MQEEQYIEMYNEIRQNIEANQPVIATRTAQNYMVGSHQCVVTLDDNGTNYALFLPSGRITFYVDNNDFLYGYMMNGELTIIGESKTALN